jgi:hypothetical protein
VDVKLRLKDHLRRIRERLSAEQSALPPEEADKVIPGYTPIERFWARKKAAAAAWIVADVAVDGGPRLQTK